MTISRGGERALVGFGGGARTFWVYLPKGGTPSQIADAFLAITPRLSRFNYCAGEVAADFVSAVHPAVRCQLVSGPSEVNMEVTDLKYVLSYSAINGHRVLVVESKNGATKFNGKLVEFTKWAENMTGLEGIEKKIVRFKYNGGSRPGGTRTVRVETIERTGHELAICGFDLEKPDLTKSFRRYVSDRIEGDITVLN